MSWGGVAPMARRADHGIFDVGVAPTFQARCFCGWCGGRRRSCARAERDGCDHLVRELVAGLPDRRQVWRFAEAVVETSSELAAVLDARRACYEQRRSAA